MVKLKKDCNTGGCDNVFSCCYWKEKINRAWELATTSVRSIKVNGGEPQYPDGDGAVDVKVTVDTTEIQNQIDAISSEVDQLTSDVMDNSTDIINLSNLKENVLSAGDGIDIDRASSSTPIISTNVVAQNSDGMFSVWKNETKIAELTEGENVTIGPTGEVSAVDTKYTAGANVTITADNVISATGELSGTASADQILLNDNRSVQSAIDAIEDEIGDSTTGGTIQSRLEALEESTANLDTEMAGKQDALTDAQMSAVNSGATADKINAIDTNTSNINQLTSVVDTANADISALKQADVELSKAYSGFEVTKGTAGKVGLTMTAVDGTTSASQGILEAGDGINITNGVISASSEGGIQVIALPSTMTGDEYYETMRDIIGFYGKQMKYSNTYNNSTCTYDFFDLRPIPNDNLSVYNFVGTCRTLTCTANNDVYKSEAVTIALNQSRNEYTQMGIFAYYTGHDPDSIRAISSGIFSSDNPHSKYWTFKFTDCYIIKQV